MLYLGSAGRLGKRREVSDASMEIPRNLLYAAWIPTFVGMTNLAMSGKQAPASVNSGKRLYFSKESDCEEFSLDSGARRRRPKCESPLAWRMRLIWRRANWRFGLFFHDLPRLTLGFPPSRERRVTNPSPAWRWLFRLLRMCTVQNMNNVSERAGHEMLHEAALWHEHTGQSGAKLGPGVLVVSVQA